MIFNSNIKHSLKKDFIQSISTGLRRRTVISCSKWAEAYRMMHDNSTNIIEKWNFKKFPWLRDMHDSKAEINVGQKAAQLGYTETVLNITFFEIDINQRDVLYVLPAKTPDASNFSAARFDPALELSPHLNNLFSDVKNVGHKRAASANLYIRGARSRSGLKSIPVGFLVLDEINEMPRKNITLALERTSGQATKKIWMISTPSVEDFGISIHYKRSSQNHFYFRCPSCSRFTELSYPESLVIHGEYVDDPVVNTSYIQCNLCKNILPHESKSEWLTDSKWIESYSNKDIKGWHISQLYSSYVSPADIARSYFIALSDSSEEQEFYNSKLGLTHEAKDSRVTDSQIEEVRGGYNVKQSMDSGLITLGADIGYPWIHYVVVDWRLPEYPISNDLNIIAKARIIAYGKVREFKELDEIMKCFKIRFAVIDAMPERRNAYEFSTRFNGRVRLAFYGNSITGKQIHLNDEDEPTVTVDRTSWLDLTLGRFRAKTISLPADTDYEFCEQIKALVRITRKDRQGNPMNEYINTKADHYAHALNYAEIALPLGASLSSNQTISKVF